MRRYSPVLVRSDVRRSTGPIRTDGCARARRDEPLLSVARERRALGAEGKGAKLGNRANLANASKAGAAVNKREADERVVAAGVAEMRAHFARIFCTA